MNTDEGRIRGYAPVGGDGVQIEDDKMTGGRDEKELRLQQGIDGSDRPNWVGSRKCWTFSRYSEADVDRIVKSEEWARET